jgi:hypothetical protein
MAATGPYTFYPTNFSAIEVLTLNKQRCFVVSFCVSANFDVIFSLA